MSENSNVRTCVLYNNTQRKSVFNCLVKKKYFLFLQQYTSNIHIDK